VDINNAEKSFPYSIKGSDRYLFRQIRRIEKAKKTARACALAVFASAEAG
jgi:hypothetical protein